MGLSIKKPEGTVGKASNYDKHMTAQQAVGTVQATKTVKGKIPTLVLDTTEVVHTGVVAAPEEMCHVSVSGDQTINMGNYESVKIHVGLTMPCKKADIEETFEYVSDWVSSKMKKATEETKE